jgi:hypothetical protein
MAILFIILREHICKHIKLVRNMSKKLIKLSVLKRKEQLLGWKDTKEKMLNQ